MSRAAGSSAYALEQSIQADRRAEGGRDSHDESDAELRKVRPKELEQAPSEVRAARDTRRGVADVRRAVVVRHGREHVEREVLRGAVPEPDERVDECEKQQAQRGRGLLGDWSVAEPLQAYQRQRPQAQRCTSGSTGV